jgi:DNA-binding transcriptional MocR family regulator
LPTERSLAVELSVSRSTVVAAYDLLRGEGWLESRQGSGTWVRRHASVVRFGEDRHGFFGRSTVSFRALLEGPGEGIDLTCAAMTAGDLFARPAVAKALADLDRVARSEIGYEAPGYPPLRTAIAEHLTGRWGLPTATEQVIVTSGAQQAVGLAVTLYARPGDVAIVEDPTYLAAIDVFSASNVACCRCGSACGGSVRRLPGDARGVALPRAPCRRSTTDRNGDASAAPRDRVSGRERSRSSRTSRSPTWRWRTSAPADGAFRARSGPVDQTLSKLLWGGLRVGWIRAPEP